MNKPHDPHQHDPHRPDEPDAGAPTADPPPWPMPALEAPVRVVFTGEPVDDDWPLGNTITVEVIETDNPSFVADTAQAREEAEWAADSYTRPLVLQRRFRVVVGRRDVGSGRCGPGVVVGGAMSTSGERCPCWSRGGRRVRRGVCGSR